MVNFLTFDERSGKFKNKKMAGTQQGQQIAIWIRTISFTTNLCRFFKKKKNLGRS